MSAPAVFDAVSGRKSMNKTKKDLIMKKVLLPVLFASVGMLLLAGCKPSPKKVVQNYVKASLDGDEAAVLALVDGKDMKKEAVSEANGGKSFNALRNAKFGKARIQDNEAWVPMTYEVSGEVHLKMIDGKWKVVDVK